MVSVRRPFRALIAALALLPLAACDEVGATAEDVETAVDDAVIARQSGDYDQAVEILEDALKREPENAEVRVELATTVLERDGIDLLDVDRIAQFVTRATGEGAPAAPAEPGARAACRYAADPTARPFNPVDVAGFEDLARSAGSVSRALDLLGPVVPPALQSFDVCTSVADGALDYDRDGAVAALRARGLSEGQVRQTLAVNALARFIDAYLYVSTELPEQTTWYRLSDGSVAICVEDEDAVRDQAEAAVQDFGEAVLSLDARASLMGGGSAAADIVDLALDAYEDLRDAIADYCSSEG